MSNSVVKIIVVGESAVGKTSMIHQFVDRSFSADFKSTIGSDFSAKAVAVDDALVNLQIWDTAGQERYRSLSTSYFKGCEAAIIVFDMTDANSYARVHHWFEEVKRSCNLTPSDVNGTNRFPVFVVANKADLDNQRHVPKKEAHQLCTANGWEYAECSAKYGEGIDQVFKSVAVKVVDRRNKMPSDVTRAASVGRVGAGNSRRGGAAGQTGGAARDDSEDSSLKRKLPCCNK
jgi:small GTP-binding protein